MNYIYEDGDKICPIMSLRMIVFSGKFVACMGEKCMWWERCKREAVGEGGETK